MNVCQLCGVAIIGREHIVGAVVGLRNLWVVTVCTRCRDRLEPELLEVLERAKAAEAVRPT